MRKSLKTLTNSLGKYVLLNYWEPQAGPIKQKVLGIIVSALHRVCTKLEINRQNILEGVNGENIFNIQRN